MSGERTGLRPVGMRLNEFVRKLVDESKFFWILRSRCAFDDCEGESISAVAGRKGGRAKFEGLDKRVPPGFVGFDRFG